MWYMPVRKALPVFVAVVLAFGLCPVAAIAVNADFLTSQQGQLQSTAAEPANDSDKDAASGFVQGESSAAGTEGSSASEASGSESGLGSDSAGNEPAAEADDADTAPENSMAGADASQESDAANDYGIGADLGLTGEPDDASVQALSGDNIVASGVWGTCPWEIDDEWTLTIYPGVGEDIPAPYEGSPWYGYWSDLKKVVFKSTNGAKVIAEGHNLRWLFAGYSFVESFDLSGLDTSRATDMTGMFQGCERAAFLDLSGFDTSNVENMSYLFSNCSALTSLDLSIFDTSKVTDMGNMFAYCSSLASLDLSGFDTSGVTDMKWMFDGCKSLSSLGISSFNTSNVTDMSIMFRDCSSLESLDLSGFDTRNVTSMSAMFNGCSSLASLDLSSFDTSSVAGMEFIFEGCSSLTSLDLSSFDTSNLTHMHKMFHNCSSLESLDLSSFDTSNVTVMHNMFDGCSSLKSVDLSSFNTSQVTEMGYMFYNCSSLESLDLSSFDTSRVTEMGYMFRDCSSLVSLDLSSFDTSRVTGMYHMFRGCSSLTSLDLSGFDTSKAEWMQDMYYQCDSLLEVTLGNVNPFVGSGNAKAELPRRSYPYYSWGKGSPYSSERFASQELAAADFSNGAMAGTYYWGEYHPCVVYDSSDGSLTFLAHDPVEGITSAQQVFRDFDTAVYSSPSNVPWHGVRESIKSVSFADGIAPRSMANWFCGCTELEVVDLSGLDTTSLTDSTQAFYGCAFKSVIVGGKVDLKKLDLLPNPPSEAPYTGLWARVDGGEPVSAADLQNRYDPSTMAGEYAWDYDLLFNSLTLEASGVASRIDPQDHIVDVYVTSDYNPDAAILTFDVSENAKVYASNPGEDASAAELISGSHGIALPFGRTTTLYLKNENWKVVSWDVRVNSYSSYWLDYATDTSETATFGYTESPSLDVLITNTGDSALPGIASGLSVEGDTDCIDWAMLKDGGPFNGDLDPGDSVTLRFIPAMGLDVGSYELRARLNISGVADLPPINARVTVVPRDASGLGAVMTGISGRTYNGKAQTQSPKVTVGETTLVEGKDYNLVYKNNVNAGTAVVSAVGAGNYAGTLVSATFSIAKANNPMAVKAVAKTVKAKKVKKKKQAVAGCVKFTKKAQGKVTYKKVSGAKKLSINAKTGKITVKKGTKKGTYKIKVRVTAAGSANYKAATKTLTLKVRVK